MEVSNVPRRSCVVNSAAGAAMWMSIVATAAEEGKPGVEGAATQRVREQAVRNVNRVLGSRSEGLFVVALGEATLAQSRVGGAREGGERPKTGGERPQNSARPGEGARTAQSQVSWQFKVLEGRDAASAAVVDFMSAATPASPRDWRFVQRFNANEREQADAAVARLQQQSAGGEGNREGKREGR